MKKLALFAGALALVTFTPAAASGMSADPRHRLRFGVATNWAGYFASGGPFTSVSTTWTEPSISCPAGSHSALASFAGLDGANNGTVEQIGTVSMCGNGRVAHTAFYEMFPRGPNSIGKQVQAGDSLTATVTATTSKLFTLTLVNNSKGWSFSTQQRSSKAQRTSAEAITEAPTRRGSGVVNLANFGTINYSNPTANGLSFAGLGANGVTMESNAGVIKAEPSGLTSTGFSVMWVHA